MGCITAYNASSSPKSRLAFENLLFDTQLKLNNASKANSSDYLKLNGTALEIVVYDEMKKLCGKYGFEEKDIVLLSGHNFPDIITQYLSNPKYFGVEVKTTKENKWTSTGSSIVESTRDVNVDNIYMFFGKLSKPFAEFKVRKYEECLCDIAVTHSPRYLINMDLGEDENIFAKMGTTYDDFRNSSNNIDQARIYYRKLAEEKENETGMKELPWWLNTFDTRRESVAPEKIVDISLYSRLSESMKVDLKSKGFILFFEDILSNRQDKYESVVLWFCKKYSVIVHNARDLYTAGGQGFIEHENLTYGPYHRVLISLVEYRHHIKDILDAQKPDFKEDLNERFGIDSLSYEEWVVKISDYMNSNPQYSSMPIGEFLRNI
ncbi:MAG: hypothetical protein MJZ33_06120 [Paludibacteraceae bacterium]|nr:hypothetical protein [Paludibacteraceae bacterium]